MSAYREFKKNNQVTALSREELEGLRSFLQREQSKQRLS